LAQPHGKTWGKLVQNGQAEAQALGLDHQPHVLVGTVPVQHSYGFESTFLLTLHGGCSFWSGKPFYPQDVVEALVSVPQPRMLVTTPHHLTALLGSAVDWPALDLCLSATAALSPELAAQVEQRSGAPVLEIYGSTESSQLAYRRTTEGSAWCLLPGVVLEQDMGTDMEMDATYACGGHVEGRVLLSDIIHLQADGRFLLHGRHADLINMAGKRTSLAYLNCQLCAITGVSDGAFFLPDTDAASGFVRLMAFVVAPGLAREALMAALRLRIDPIFLPRPLVFVDSLPRNSTGKLPRDALVSLYQDQVARG
jgi:acyl-coenzyme A synthetase/AMP-(fatty) acid ligase